jgi:hypothetical protein
MRGTIQAPLGISDKIQAPFTYTQSGIRRHNDITINHRTTPINKTTTKQHAIHNQLPPWVRFSPNYPVPTPYYVYVGNVSVFYWDKILNLFNFFLARRVSQELSVLHGKG